MRLPRGEEARLGAVSGVDGNEPIEPGRVSRTTGRRGVKALCTRRRNPVTPQRLKPRSIKLARDSTGADTYAFSRRLQRLRDVGSTEQSRPACPNSILRSRGVGRDRTVCWLRRCGALEVPDRLLRKVRGVAPRCLNHQAKYAQPAECRERRSVQGAAYLGRAAGPTHWRGQVRRTVYAHAHARVRAQVTREARRAPGPGTGPARSRRARGRASRSAQTASRPSVRARARTDPASGPTRGSLDSDGRAAPRAVG